VRRCLAVPLPLTTDQQCAYREQRAFKSGNPASKGIRANGRFVGTTMAVTVVVKKRPKKSKGGIMPGKVTVAELLPWFPKTPYYREHAERLVYSFNNLPSLPKGFSCLCIGSWGAEGPFLISQLGAAKVTCIRSPVDGVPKHQTCRLKGPDGRKYETELWASNIEADEIPVELREFDLVLMWEVLEHLNLDPARSVYQGIRALKNGGIISITTPNALWHVLTIAQLSGINALGLKLQHHIPFATHWRLYSPAEVAQLCKQMGCRIDRVTSFLNDQPYPSFKSRLMLKTLRFLRRNSGNGECSYGQTVFVTATKESEKGLCRPDWLYPKTVDTSCEEQLNQDANRPQMEVRTSHA